MIRVLELFSGGGSVGKVCEELGYECISVDIEYEATHKIDILKFDYKQYGKDDFDIIWASPPCTYYSGLQRAWLGKKKRNGIYTEEKHEQNLIESDKLVLKALEIINYFKPALWFMENPQTGTLKSRDIMKDIPFYDVDYCMYSDWGYRKRTRVWTNKENFNNKKCDGSGSCGNMIKIPSNSNKLEERNLHKTNCGNSKILQNLRKHSGSIEGVGGGTNRLERYRIPHQLIKDLFL